jgi:hypothetical protein
MQTSQSVHLARGQGMASEAGRRYTAKAACFASRVPHYKLNGWARGGLLSKLSLTARSGSWRRYSYDDIAVIAVAGRLTDIGFEIRDAINWALICRDEKRRYDRIGRLTIYWYPDEQAIRHGAMPRNLPLPAGKPECEFGIEVDDIFDAVQTRLGSLPEPAPMTHAQRVAEAAKIGREVDALVADDPGEPQTPEQDEALAAARKEYIARMEEVIRPRDPAPAKRRQKTE